MLPDELTFLATQAAKCRRVVEIGSFRGRSARAIADNLSGDGHLFSVDPWTMESSDLPLVKMYFSEIGDKPVGWLLEDYKRNMEGLSNYTILQMTSLEAASHCRGLDLKFDMVFIDGAHDYDNVKADILAWLPLLSPGGLICGHDYDPVNWPGVVRAVSELLPNASAVADTIWRA